MNVNAISTNSYWWSQVNNPSQPLGTASVASGGTPSAGGFQGLILNALSGSGTAGSDPTGTTTAASLNPTQQQAMGAFMQSLFQALHAQNGATGSSGNGMSSTDSDGDTDGSTGGARGAGRHGGHQRMNMASDLQSLMSQLASSSATTTATNAAPGGTATTGNLSNLQSSFQTLADAMGVSGANLSSFLSNLSSQLPVQNRQQAVNTYA